MSETRGKGRPTDYNVKLNDQVYKLALLGLTDKKIADVLGICEATLNNWKEAHPDFLESLKKGKEFSDIEVAASLLKRAKGYRYKETEMRHEDPDNPDGVIVKTVEKEMPPDTAAAYIWLKNRQPEFWRERRENKTININVDSEKDGDIRDRVEKLWKEF